MAYGVMNVNDGVGRVENMPSAATSYSRFETGLTASQMDTIMFSDFIQSATTAGTVPISGGVFVTPVSGGGSVTSNSTTDYASFGIDNSIGILRLETGTTNNATAYSAVQSSISILGGIPTPTNSFITKYEFECNIETDANIFGATRNGSIRFGAMSTATNSAPNDGVYFEFLYDGTTNDTTWNIVFRNNPNQERVNTNVTVSASTGYRLYLSVERNSAGTFTTTYSVKNLTTGVTTSGTAAPSVPATYYPLASTDTMGVGLVCAKAGTATANSTFILVDYIYARIRRKLDREMIIFST